MRFFAGLFAVGLILAVAGTAGADSYSQGFEGSGYNFYADPGSWAGISNTVFYSGSQSAQFTLDAAPFAYTRWKSEDISSKGILLKDIVASDWVMRTLGRSDLSPYLLFTIATPDTSQETLAIQFSMASIVDNVWTQNIVDQSTLVHVNGDRTGLLSTEFSPSYGGGTLAALSAKTYTPGQLWGDFLVTYVRVGVGLWDASQAYNGYADDVVVTGASAPIPEPLTMAGLMLGIGGLVGYVRKRRKA